MSVNFAKYSEKFGAVSQKRVIVTIKSIKEKISSTGKKFYTVAGENKFGEMEFFTAFPDQLAKIEATEDDMAPGRTVEIGYVEKPSDRGAPFKNMKSCKPVHASAGLQAAVPSARTQPSNDIGDDEAAKLLDGMAF